MLDDTYEIDYERWFTEGGYCQVYPLKNYKHIIFKEFINKQRAIKAFVNNKKLAKYDLAPKIFSKVCKLNFAYTNEPRVFDTSDWGYIIEMADTNYSRSLISLLDIQNLVDEIQDKTGLKFWDCHFDNLGFIKRNRSKKLVCIDTGMESFNGDANAWGNNSPGPKCEFCTKYGTDCLC
jgi:hypothetical protein